jgi:hypothetical protein
MWGRIGLVPIKPTKRIWPSAPSVVVRKAVRITRPSELFESGFRLLISDLWHVLTPPKIINTHILRLYITPPFPIPLLLLQYFLSLIFLALFISIRIGERRRRRRAGLGDLTKNLYYKVLNF